MNNKLETNLHDKVVEVIAQTQDGKKLKPGNTFDYFFLQIIDDNTNYCIELGEVNIENLFSDFNYMIDQIQRAKKPLKQYLTDNPS